MNQQLGRWLDIHLNALIGRILFLIWRFYAAQCAYSVRRLSIFAAIYTVDLPKAAAQATLPRNTVTHFGTELSPSELSYI